VDGGDSFLMHVDGWNEFLRLFFSVWLSFFFFLGLLSVTQNGKDVFFSGNEMID